MNHELNVVGTAPSAPVAPILVARGVSKSYGAVRALEPTEFSVSEGVIHGLLGKNGAGKSTLVGVIAGAIKPTGGRVEFRGHDVTDIGLVARRRLGISLLSQHPEIVPHLTVAENLLLPDYPVRGALVDWRAVRRKAQDTLESHFLDVSVDALAGELSVPDQRKLAIVKTLTGEGTLAMLDEPTTALTQSERRAFFDWIRGLNAGGVTFIFISHYTSEIREVCTEFTVLRDGRIVASGTDPGAIPVAQLARLVVGSDVTEFGRQVERHLEPLLELREFRARDCEPLTLTLGRGEIVGFVGLPGSGASEVARALAGLAPIDGGRVQLEDVPLTIDSVARAVDHGIAYLTRDRTGDGLFPEMSVQENLCAGRWSVNRRGFLDMTAIHRTFAAMRERLAIAANGGEEVRNLSGGNQQKVLLGRLVATQPKVLILDEPTLGIDVGAKEEVHKIIDQLTREGIGVILLAYDIEELVRLVDRALVFREGRVTEELSGAALTIEGVLRALGGERGRAPLERSE